MSLVSVVMPVYNGIQFLQESIDSILEQSHDELEFIIIDDASTEPVLDLINSCHDTRIVVRQTIKNIGLTKCLNIGFAMAHGDYIVRHDADDISFAIRIEEQLKLFKEDTGFVGCWASSINANNEFVKGFVDEHCCCDDEDLIFKYPNELCMADATTMYSKEAVEKVGQFDEMMYLGQTYNYNLRVLKFFNAKVVPEVLYLARQHERQTGREIRREMRPLIGGFSWSTFAQDRANMFSIIPWRDNVN